MIEFEKIQFLIESRLKVAVSPLAYTTFLSLRPKCRATLKTLICNYFLLLFPALVSSMTVVSGIFSRLFFVLISFRWLQIIFPNVIQIPFLVAERELCFHSKAL